MSLQKELRAWMRGWQTGRDKGAEIKRKYCSSGPAVCSLNLTSSPPLKVLEELVPLRPPGDQKVLHHVAHVLQLILHLREAQDRQSQGQVCAALPWACHPVDASRSHG